MTHLLLVLVVVGVSLDWLDIVVVVVVMAVVIVESSLCFLVDIVMEALGTKVTEVLLLFLWSCVITHVY